MIEIDRDIELVQTVSGEMFHVVTGMRVRIDDEEHWVSVFDEEAWNWLRSKIEADLASFKAFKETVNFKHKGVQK